MTESKAKEIIEALLFYDLSTDEETAVTVAVKALEEIQEYRAIGTVEELQSMKDNGAFSGMELAQLAIMQMRLKEYEAIGTVDEFKALKEKSVAKKSDVFKTE